MDAAKSLAANLRRLRAERGWSQEDLSERSGLHRTYVSGLERGVRNPTLGVLETLACAFATDIAEFLR